MAKRFGFPSHGTCRCNTVLGLGAINEPVVKTVHFVADTEVADVPPNRLDNAGKLVPQHNWKWTRRTGLRLKRGSPLNLRAHDRSRMDFDQYLICVGVRLLDFPRNEGFGSALFLKIDRFHSIFIKRPFHYLSACE